MAALTGFSLRPSKLRIDALARCFHSAAMKLIFHTLMVATVGLVAFVTCARAQVEPVTNAVPLDAATMQRIYDEVKTPFKYGVVLRGDSTNQLVDCPNIFRADNKWFMMYVAITGKTGYETFLAESDDLVVRIADPEVHGHHAAHRQHLGALHQHAAGRDVAGDHDRLAVELAPQDHGEDLIEADMDPLLGGARQAVVDREWLHVFGCRLRSYMKSIIAHVGRCVSAAEMASVVLTTA